MSCQSPTCTTVQIIEPNDDLLVDTGGTSSDMDERGEVELVNAQTSAVIQFQVLKLSADYNFEYLYVDAIGDVHPGGVHVIPSFKSVEGFTVLFAGAPIGTGYVLHWRVTIVRTSILGLTDYPEDLYLQMPRTPIMTVTFHNPRSSTTYGFTELRVENLTDVPAIITPIHTMVHQKTVSGFSMLVNPAPPTDNYYIRIRTP